MFYERKVKYLDFLVNGEKQGNAGFVKLEVRDNACNIYISINYPKINDITLPVYIAGNQKEEKLCTLPLSGGKGAVQLVKLAREDIGGTGISYDALEAIRIPLSAEREIYGAIRVVQEVKEVSRAVDEEEKKEIIEEETTDTKIMEEETVEEEKRYVIHENKWKQLWEIYPHIAPFRDEREYLSMSPADFVILPGKYYRMANNSFLLHGYYNYKHLVLKRAEVRGEERYYIGVPGNFYDREKQVAVMFGFEGFESKKEAADPGDYGYYLMRIEL